MKDEQGNRDDIPSFWKVATTQQCVPAGVGLSKEEKRELETRLSYLGGEKER